MGRRISRFIAGRSLLSQLTARRLNAILDAIEESKPIAGRGLQMRQTSGGIVLDNTQKGGGGGVTVTGGSVSYPFDMTVVPNATTPETHIDVTFKVGSVGYILPSNIFTAHTITNTDSYWVYADCVTGSGRISSSTINFSLTEKAEPAPTANVPPSTFSVLLGYVVAGQALNIIKKNPVPWSGVRYQLQRPAPIAPGEPAWDYYYSWTW